MVLYYHLLAFCLSLWYSTIGLMAPCLFLSYSFTFYCVPAFTYDTKIPSTGPLSISMVLSCLYIWLLLPFSGSLTIPMVLFYFLVSPCRYLWYSTIFYFLPAFTYDTLLFSTGYLPIPLILYHILLAHRLSLWYSTMFYWPTAYSYGTLMVLYYLLLAHCLYLLYTTTFYWPTTLSLWYSTIYYWLPAFPYGTLPLSNASLPIPMVLFYLLRAPCRYLWYFTFFYCLPAYK